MFPNICRSNFNNDLPYSFYYLFSDNLSLLFYLIFEMELMPDICYEPLRKVFLRDVIQMH